jgi:hypothetical protein
MVTAFGSKHSFLLAYEQSKRKHKRSQFRIVSFEVFCGVTSLQFLLVKGRRMSVNLVIIWEEQKFRFFTKASFTFRKWWGGGVMNDIRA